MPNVKRSLKTERIELRVSAQAKHRIETAAQLSGKTITDVIMTAVDVYLDRLYSERFSLASLTREDKIQMVKALVDEQDTPTAPNPFMVNVLREYKQALQSANKQSPPP
jgi:uncharacterized protein (DUF1778 family)